MRNILFLLMRLFQLVLTTAPNWRKQNTLQEARFA